MIRKEKIYIFTWLHKCAHPVRNGDVVVLNESVRFIFINCHE